MKQAPVLNEREKQRMLQHLQRTSYAARNRCMLQLSWLAGMRVGEIAALDIGDVQGADGAIPRSCLTSNWCHWRTAARFASSRLPVLRLLWIYLLVPAFRRT
jgi:hypothetical protein